MATFILCKNLVHFACIQKPQWVLSHTIMMVAFKKELSSYVDMRAGIQYPLDKLDSVPIG
jgi:hypothetical protein